MANAQWLKNRKSFNSRLGAGYNSKEVKAAAKFVVDDVGEFLIAGAHVLRKNSSNIIT